MFNLKHKNISNDISHSANFFPKPASLMEFDMLTFCNN